MNNAFLDVMNRFQSRFDDSHIQGSTDFMAFSCNPTVWRKRGNANGLGDQKGKTPFFIHIKPSDARLNEDTINIH